MPPVSLDRLDERTLGMERRIARLEIVVIAMAVGGLGVLAKFVFSAVGLQ